MLYGLMAYACIIRGINNRGISVVFQNGSPNRGWLDEWFRPDERIVILFCSDFLGVGFFLNVNLAIIFFREISS